MSTNTASHQSNYPILSAAEFIAQGTTAGAIMSIGDALASAKDGHVQQHVLASRVRQIAHEVAALTGQSLQIPAAITNARFLSRQRPKRAANDNRGGKRKVA